MRRFAAADRGSYGLLLIGEPITIRSSIDVFPGRSFPIVATDLVPNLHVTVEDDRSKPIKPSHEPAANASPPVVMVTNRVEFPATTLAAWGFEVERPGRYHVSFSFDHRTTDWAKAHGWFIEDAFAGDVQIVRRYSDVDPHLFPPPTRWQAAPEDCLPRQTVRLTFMGRFAIGENIEPPDLARAKTDAQGLQCFIAIRGTSSLREGLDAERSFANREGSVLLSEDDRVPCGSIFEAVLTYRSKSAPYTYTQAAILRTHDGYIVARYRRPYAAPDDPDAREALEAPCLLL